MAFAADRGFPEECLPKTRKKVLEEIVAWIHRPSESYEEPQPCAYWPHGVASRGKSVIASTVTRQMKNLGRCAWYFFDASRQIEADPQRMFNMLSLMIADMGDRWQ